LSQCPVCLGSAQKYLTDGDYNGFVCLKCGQYEIEGTAHALLPSKLGRNADASPILSHYIRRRVMQAAKTPFISEAWVKETLDNKSLPSILEQGRNLILWLGDMLNGRIDRSFRDVTYESIASIVGAYNESNVLYLLRSLQDKGFLPSDLVFMQNISLQLTFNGWEQYEELRKGVGATKKAFMAMPFGFARLNENFQNWYI
jgi:hypothetical protein